MPLYRNELPQLSGNLFLTEGGLETTLVFHEHIDLPELAGFVLLKNEDGCETLRKYYRRYLDIAKEHKMGFILTGITWRASQDWGKKLGYSLEQINEFNCKSIELLHDIRREYEDSIPHLVISGSIGPRGDGYKTETSMTVSEAEAYHRTQIEVFRETEADMVTAFTIPYVAEGIGIALAAKSEKMPVAISFTVETDGNLPSGETLKDAIEQVDSATDNAPVYYMINCSHPTHFASVLRADEPWTKRIRGLRANSSPKSHAELDGAIELDEGNPQELALQYLDLRGNLENLNVVGGCCGTDHRHVTEICKAFVNIAFSSVSGTQGGNG